MDVIFQSMESQKIFYFFISFYSLLLSNFIDCHDKYSDAYLALYSTNFTVEPSFYDSSQSSQAQNDLYDFPAINNGGFSQDMSRSLKFNSYQLHAISVLKSCVEIGR